MLGGQGRAGGPLGWRSHGRAARSGSLGPRRRSSASVLAWNSGTRGRQRDKASGDRMTVDDPKSDLSRRKTAGWIALTGGAQAVRFVLTLVSTAVLARLLSPTDFGLI